MPRLLRFALVASAILLHGCGMLVPKAPAPPDPSANTMPPATRVAPPVAPQSPEPQPAARLDSKPVPKIAKSPPHARARNTGRYFQNDGPGDIPAAKLHAVPDATPRDEPLAAFANQRYVIFGKTYTPETERRMQHARGVASWYGRKFHGRLTSIGEKYDMYSMTAAHPTLPLPSYVRVTNLETKRSVIVRVNDRGPFLRGRLIDVSYAAAVKLGFAHKGSARVEITTIVPVTTLAANGTAPPADLGTGLAWKD